MAILNDLIVRGATRCLNTLYAKDLNTEDLTITGYTYMGNSTARDDTKLSVAGISNNSWYRSTGEVGWQSDTYGGGIYMTDATYVRTYGSKAFLAINGLYTGASAQYYLNSSGKLVVNEANANSLSTKFASVSNTLRATKYDLQTVTQMGTNGTLYVAPSIQFPTSNGGTTVTTTANSITITDTNITSATLAGIVWGAQAKVKISGTFNGVVSGTVDGVVTSINTTSKVLVIGSLSGGNWSSVPAGTYTASKIINLNITMYENASSKPVGILLTSYGAVSEHTDGTAKTYIDIYGGSNTKPVVRIGQMTNLDAINGVTPNGWGLYTTHGYFSGLIVSNEGKIGGWTLGSNSLTTGTWGTTNSAMLCTGSDISKTIADSGSISGWVFTAGANFGVTKTGAMYCTGAKVNGNITAQSLTIASNATITGSIPQANVTNLSTSLTNAAKTATNFISTVDSTGIMVHPNGNTTTGWKISNAIELLRNNDSHMKLWIDDNSVAKIRIGKEDSKHVLIDDDSVDIVDDEDVLASFGETARIGKENDSNVSIDNNGIIINKGSKELAKYFSKGIIFDEETPYKIGNDNSYITFEDTDGDNIADSLSIVADSIYFRDTVNTNIKDTLNSLQSDLAIAQEDIDLKNNYIKINTSEPSIVISASSNTNDTNLKLESSQLSFQIDGQTTATITNDQMNIPTASVTNLFMQSTNTSTNTVYEKVWVMRTNGHLSLKTITRN